MLNQTMWDIFKKTGNMDAYLYVNEYNKCYSNKKNGNINSKREPLEIKEITII